MSCPNCESTRVVAGECIDQVGLGVASVFRLSNRRFFSFRNPIVSMPRGMRACLDCGIVWGSLNTQKLKQMVHRCGSATLKQQMENKACVKEVL